jgi:hypothetical protein
MRKLFEDKPFAVMADSGFTPNPESKPQLQKIKSYTPKSENPKEEKELKKIKSTTPSCLQFVQ